MKRRVTARTCLLLPLVLPESTNSSTVGTGYTRYSQYPDYCSTPDQLELRRIPALDLLDQGKSSKTLTKKLLTQLVHVTVVSRHGSRAPKGKHECWPGYYTDFDTAVWDCSLTTLVGGARLWPPPPSDECAIGSHSSSSSPLTDCNDAGLYVFLEKLYDGLTSSSDKERQVEGHDDGAIASNVLNGTCQVAQLLRKGYDQHLWNGRMLRSTYFQDTTSSNHPGTTPWTPLQFLSTKIEPSEYLYFRSDDEQRTIASGQALLVGLLENETNLRITIHTADKSRDVISANDDLCGRLKDLENMAYASKDYKRMKKDYDLKKTKDWMKEQFGYALDHPMQCLMTTICSDLTLPKSLDDFAQQKKHGRFQSLALYELVQKNFVYTYDHSAYAKCAMGPLWSEIVANLRSALVPFVLADKGDNASPGKSPAVPRLAYYSGHDSTISQLLASLGSKVWRLTDSVPYASLLVLEVHRVLDDDHEHYDTRREPRGSNDDEGGDDDSGHEEGKRDDGHETDDEQGNGMLSYKFRLLFNGRILTPAIKHCHSELCDLQILLDRIGKFATSKRQCQRQPKARGEDDNASEQENHNSYEATHRSSTKSESDTIPIVANTFSTASWYERPWWRIMFAVFGFSIGSVATWKHVVYASESLDN